VRRITTPDLLAEIVAPPAAPQSSLIENRITELQKAIERAWEPYVAGKISQEMAERLADQYVKELERLRQGHLPEAPAPTPAYDDLAQRFAGAVAGAIAFEDQRALLRLLDVRIYIGPDGPERLTVCIP